MKDQHTKIKGYRDLSAEEIALMNEGKELAQKVGEFVEKLERAEVETTKARTGPLFIFPGILV
ncbi:TPA: hypothetical protein ACGT9A_005023 [Klebsiella pneumoniae]